MFEWKTGDDEWADGAEADPGPAAAAPSARFSRLWAGLGLLLLACVVIGGAGLLYRQVDSRVTAVTDSRHAEIIAADRLLLEAAVTHDDELFASLIAARPRAWPEDQLRLLSRHLWLNRAPLGLWLDAEAALNPGPAITDTEVILAPDLTLAEVKTPLPYLTVDGQGKIQPFALQRTAVYRLQDDSWLLVEPDDEFWGEYEHAERPYLDLVAPEREFPLAAQLADDLSALVEEVCAHPEVGCPPDFMLQLRLSREPERMLTLYPTIRLSTVYLGQHQTTRLSLPSPTLVGLPLDEAGYQALLRGYGTHVSLALLNAYNIDQDTSRPFGSDFATGEFVAVLADLGFFTPWPPEYHPTFKPPPPPIPLPEKDIVAMCQGSRAPLLFRYDMAEGAWFDLPLQTEGAVTYARSLPLPDGRGLLLSVASVSDNLTRLVWVNDGRDRVLLTDPRYFEFSGVTALAPGRYLLHFQTWLGGQNQMRTHHQAMVLDEATCEETQCELEPFTGAEQLSPDGRARLITRLHEDHGFTYTVSDDSGENSLEIGPVLNPFWLDEQTLVFTQVEFEGSVNGTEFETQVTAVAPGAESGAWQTRFQITSEMLQAALPAQDRLDDLQLTSAGPHPHHPEALLLSASTIPNRGVYEGQTYLFAYDWHQKALSLWQPGGMSLTPGLYMGKSPHGRYLNFISLSDSLRGETAVTAYDLETERLHSYPLASPRFFWQGVTWSEDDAWLLLPDADGVHLIAPAHDYQQMLFHGLAYCESAAWIEWP